VGAGLGGGQCVGGEVIDLVLALLHAADVVRQGDAFVVAPGGAEAQQPGDAFLVGVVLAHALLQHLAEVFPDLGVVVLAVLGDVVQQVQGLAHAAVADHLHVPGLLQDFPGDVQRQVGGVDDAAHEAQVGGHQLAGVLHDEHPLDVELHAGLGVPVPQVEGGVGGHVQQGGVVLATLDLHVGPGQGILVVVAHVLVEGLVFVLADVVLGAGPEGVGRLTVSVSRLSPLSLTNSTGWRCGRNIRGSRI
jgi:hypothetical protein